MNNHTCIKVICYTIDVDDFFYLFIYYYYYCYCVFGVLQSHISQQIIAKYLLFSRYFAYTNDSCFNLNKARANGRLSPPLIQASKCATGQPPVRPHLHKYLSNREHVLVRQLVRPCPLLAQKYFILFFRLCTNILIIE